MLGLNTGGRGLVLPQINGQHFVDFPWESLLTGRSGWGVGWGEAGGGVEGRTVDGMQDEILKMKMKNVF